jgi:hypothetical protein
MSRVSIAILILIILGFIMTIQRDGPYVITGDPSATVITVDNDKKGTQNHKTTQPARAKPDVISTPSNLPFGAAKSAAEAADAKKAAAEDVTQLAEPDEGNQQKQSLASVDSADTGENTEKSDDANDAGNRNNLGKTTNAPSYRSQQEVHRKPRVEKPRRKFTKRRARSRAKARARARAKARQRYNDKKAARKKRQRRSATRRWRRREYRRNSDPYWRRRYHRRRVWEDYWEPELSYEEY